MKEAIEKALVQRIEKTKQGQLKEAMLYAITAGGKRVRPQIILEVIKAYGLNENDYLDLATAIEMIHTYSLIHDDLPAMDDDDLRRGKKTLHKVYDEGLAILAGDALLTDAFLVVVEQNKISDFQKTKIIDILARKAGSQGMVYGQYKDLEMEGSNPSLDVLKDIHKHKTACLIEASFMIGAVIGNINDINVWEHIGYHLGMMFQIQDDILDVIQSEEVMGKTLSDQENEKQTYITHIGLKESKKAVIDHYNNILYLLNTLHLKTQRLKQLFEDILNRSY